jgi:hypothetical protein
MIHISLAVAIVISMATMALILMEYGNKQREIYQPMQIKISRSLSIGGSSSRKEITNCVSK